MIPPAVHHSSRHNVLRSVLAGVVCALLAACSQEEGGAPPSSSAARPPASPQVPQQNAAALPTAPAAVDRRDQKLPDFSGLVVRQGPAVVNVVTSRAVASPARGRAGDPFSEFFRRFAPDAPDDSPRAQGIGSGFIVSADGEVLTNAHVVADADTVTVRMADGKHEYKGRVIGIDLRSDVALLKIEATGLPVATLGASGNIKPGEWVAAIGSPFGFANTITAGIVSATERVLPGGSLVPFIQTDVAVNPGNSGGPLLNMNGDVIGINSMIYSGTGGYMGVSFAIPIEVALDVAKQLQKNGKVTRGKIGVGIQPVTQELARAFRLENQNGVIVTNVEAGGPAASAGVRTGDVILAYNGRAIEEPTQLPRLVAQTRPGERAKLQISRKGDRREITVTVAELPGDAGAAQRPARQSLRRSDQLGLALSELPPAGRDALGVDYGLVVEEATAAAAAAGLEAGDVIVAVNDNTFSSRDEFARLLGQTKGDEPVALLVRREQGALYVALNKPRGTAKAG